MAVQLRSQKWIPTPTSPLELMFLSPRSAKGQEPLLQHPGEKVPSEVTFWLVQTAILPSLPEVRLEYDRVM
jgi:hypothetical protein